MISEFEVCFQGFTFIESNLLADDFIIKVSPDIRMVNGIYRIVSYGGKRDSAMREKEKLALKSLYGAKYCIESSVGFIERNLIKVNAGPLIGRESIIRKIN